ncbi:MAG: hypothetical protein PSX36_03030 [bacterium]|nr:hypothetical protein [bacterium]
MAKQKKSAGKKKAAKSPMKAAKKGAKKVVKKKAAKKAKKTKPRKKREDLNCFLTTACVRHFGLRDNGYELNTLRNFRDTYLSSNASGKKLILEYYRISPLILESIEKDPQKEKIFHYIHEQVLEACKEIELKKLSAARNTYMVLVQNLKHQYLS